MMIIGFFFSMFFNLNVWLNIEIITIQQEYQN
jgi:hypothetical protein